MTFKERWDDPFGQLLNKLDLPSFPLPWQAVLTL